MIEQTLKRCFLAGIIFALIATFTNLIYLVNAYESMVEGHSKNVVAAFSG